MSFLERVFRIGAKVLSINPNSGEVEEGVVHRHIESYFAGVDGLFVDHGDNQYMEHDTFSITSLNPGNESSN